MEHGRVDIPQVMGFLDRPHWLAVPTVAMSTLVFFTRSKERAPGQLPQFLLMLACMGCLVWLATKAPRTGQLTDAASFRLKPIAWGVARFLAVLLVRS